MGVSVGVGVPVGVPEGVKKAQRGGGPGFKFLGAYKEKYRPLLMANG